MANYRSSLTGSQMDDALSQMNNRVPEGWAVGERDGVPVGEESLYYHNNAKYYAEQAQAQAESAAESAESASQVAQETADAVIAQAFVQESAEVGAIVTIDDGADNIPLKDLKVNLAINQPGTGDPSPTNVRPIYPVTEAEVSRTGKNLFWAILGQTINPDTGEFIVADNSTWRTELIAAEGSSAITLSIVDKSTMTTGSIVIHQYDENKQHIGAVLIGYFRTVTVDTRTLNAQTKYIALNGYQNGGASGILTAKIQLELGSTATAYEPYAGQQYLVNIGINQWDEETEQGYIGNDGTLVSDTSSIRSANYCACIGGTQYCVVAPASRAIHWYDKDKTHLSYDGIGAPSTVVTAPANAAYFKLSAYLQGYPYANNMSVNYPARFNTYHAYTGNVVYGGELDVTTGVLTAKYGMVDMGTLNWTYVSGSAWNCFSVNIAGKAPGGNNFNCSWYAQGTIFYTENDKCIDGNENNSMIYTRDTSFNNDSATFKTAMSGVQLVYELATPISIQLTPTEVDTLRGDNVIWADCGDITNCEYRADLKLYIDKVVG